MVEWLFKKFGESEQLKKIVDMAGEFTGQYYSLHRLILWKSIIRYKYFIPFDGGWFDYNLIYINGKVIFWQHGITNPIFKGNMDDFERCLKIYRMENKLGKGRTFYEIRRGIVG
jgi:hypothetical protein